MFHSARHGGVCGREKTNCVVLCVGVACFTLPIVVEFERGCVILLRLYYTHFYTVIIYCT